MKRFFFKTDYIKAGKKFDYFIEFDNRDIEKVKKGEIKIDSITDFVFGILCVEKQESTALNFIPKDRKEFGSFRTFFEECFEVDILSVISRQISAEKK